MFITKVYDYDNVSLAKHAIWDKTFDVTYAGYTPIAIAGVRITNATTNGTGDSQTNIFFTQVTGNNANVRLCNGTDTEDAINIRIRVNVLYVKTGVM